MAVYDFQILEMVVEKIGCLCWLSTNNCSYLDFKLMFSSWINFKLSLNSDYVDSLGFSPLKDLDKKDKEGTAIWTAGINKRKIITIQFLCKLYVGDIWLLLYLVVGDFMAYAKFSHGLLEYFILILTVWNLFHGYLHFWHFLSEVSIFFVLNY